MKALAILTCCIVWTATAHASSEYLGCFIDQIGDRDLATFAGEYDQLTVEQCTLRCQDEHLPYAAIQYGNECRCGREYGRHGQVPDSECDRLCSNSERCGGDRRNSVYRVNRTASTCSNRLAGYRGCYAPTSLPIRMNAVESIHECVEHCATNYNYAGVLNGHLCYCTVDLSTSPADSRSCNRECVSSDDCCGGPDALSVYHIQTYRVSMMRDSPEIIVRETTAPVTTTTTTTTTTTIPTTTVAPSYVISTVLVILPNQTFNATLNSTRESLRQKLVHIMNFAFRCLANSSATNCTQTARRAKRQACSSGYDVNLVSNISQVRDTTATKYQTNYTVLDLCNANRLVEPIQVKDATDRLTRSQITDILQYDYEGTLVRATSIPASDTPPATDRKLWIIGAVLGPVAFALLLIFLFCYLHYKCRPRPTHQLLTKPTNNPPLSARSTAGPATSTPAIVQPLPTESKALHALAAHEPILGAGPAFRRLTSTESEASSQHPQPVQQSASTTIPMEEIRHQNDVERWRNKLRLQEQYHPTPSERADAPSPKMNRSNPYQHDNRVYVHDALNISTSTDAGFLPPRSSSRHPPKSPEIEAGRTKLHRLLDEVLDKAESDEPYNPDSDAERQKRRRQRRRANSISDERKSVDTGTNTPQIPHTPVIAQVSARPDPSVIRPRYNPYEAGDRTHALTRMKPVALVPKHDTDDRRHPEYSARANPPLFYDDTAIPDRAATAIDAYAGQKRTAKTRQESDREAAMRHEGGQVDRRQHRFNDDAVYVDSISKGRGQVRPAWVESEPDETSARRSDYRDEYIMAKRSVLNTKNIISSIHDELEHIVLPKSEDYHA